MSKDYLKRYTSKGGYLFNDKAYKEEVKWENRKQNYFKNGIWNITHNLRSNVITVKEKKLFLELKQRMGL